MLKRIRITLSVLIVLLSGYGLWTGTSGDLLSFILAGAAILMVILGVEEQRETTKWRASLYYAVSVFCLTASTAGFIQ
ncbi:hypothetical protein GLW04_03015 [Halobacillus litoralis]|uniref:DUF3953 domain-containing protein n=1 Tax=Halobacillus litoralis TaxID=45668 RepID=A0A845DZH8_9BACI|nr:MULTISPECIES: hypothetical protein [Halobacillus]MCA1023616.1 hypothetical protein [Halobacillus litoralis]MYL18844.1 hypothetical protein [Halobacillus litoralis]MYL31217.1 hypothetical protein [Halobacillus halophilus]MYL39532.1 hypothetical protein [Halobacillus litoralis]